MHIFYHICVNSIIGLKTEQTVEIQSTNEIQSPLGQFEYQPSECMKYLFPYLRSVCIDFLMRCPI